MTFDEQENYTRTIRGVLKDLQRKVGVDLHHIREDLEQIGWVIVLEEIETFDPEYGGKIENWVFRKLQFRLLDAINAELQGDQAKVDIDWQVTDWDDLAQADAFSAIVDEEAPERMEREHDIEFLTQDLDGREAEVIYLTYYEDLSERDIAERMGVGRKAVRYAKKTAMEKMQARGAQKGPDCLL